MTKLILVYLFSIFFVSAHAFQDQMLGFATVEVKSVEQCPDAEQYPNKVLFQRKKIDRYHQAYTGNATYIIDIDEKVGVYINIARYMDGGWKPNFIELADENACAFFMKWVGENTKKLLRENGRPEECPIEKGYYEFKDFVIDTSELPQQAAYGDFRIDFFGLEKGKNIFCLRIFVDVQPKKLY